MEWNYWSIRKLEAVKVMAPVMLHGIYRASAVNYRLPDGRVLSNVGDIPLRLEHIPSSQCIDEYTYNDIVQYGVPENIYSNTYRIIGVDGLLNKQWNRTVTIDPSAQSPTEYNLVNGYTAKLNARPNYVYTIERADSAAASEYTDLVIDTVYGMQIGDEFWVKSSGPFRILSTGLVAPDYLETDTTHQVELAEVLHAPLHLKMVPLSADGLTKGLVVLSQGASA